MALALRPFAAADDAALLSWFTDAAQLRMFAGASLRWPLNVAQLEALRRSPRLAAFTAFVPPDEARPVGHIELGLSADGRSARLARVALDPAWRGRGLGRELVSAALAEARARGVRELDLVVFVENDAARRAYASVGFRDVGLDSQDHTLLRMLLTLG